MVFCCQPEQGGKTIAGRRGKRVRDPDPSFITTSFVADDRFPNPENLMAAPVLSALAR